MLYNVGGPDRSISLEDLKSGRALPKRYRNRRLGDFLKEIDLAEGRATGLAMIYDRLERNGSPVPLVETDDDRSWFQITLHLHPAFEQDSPKRATDESNIVAALRDALVMYDQADDQADDQALEVMVRILAFLKNDPKSRDEILDYVGLKRHTDTIKRYIEPLERIGWIEKIIPEKPTSPKQKYRVSRMAEGCSINNNIPDQGIGASSGYKMAAGVRRRIQEEPPEN